MENKPMLYVPDFEDYGTPFAKMFNIVSSDKMYDCDIAKIADMVMLTGGGDIDPKYYGQKKHPATHVSFGMRDAQEHKLIETCLENAIPILGICRGAEWLTIAAGGELFQHVTNHTCSHTVTWGKIPFGIQTSSLHHQMCDLRKIKDAKVLAYASGISNFYETEGYGIAPVEPKTLKEPEVFQLPSIKGFAIQGHPEMMPEYCQFNVLARMALASFMKMEIDPQDAEHFENIRKIQKEIYSND